MRKDRVRLYISRALYEKIKQVLGESKGEFKGVEDYVASVLEKAIREEEIKRRLKNIGYPE